MRHGEDVNFCIRTCTNNNCVLLNESLIITGDGKPHFGHSVLSSNLNKMAKGELENMRLGYNLGLVSKLEYYFLVLYAVVKYLRRVILVQLGLNGRVN